jgi:hypothetical protein
MLTRGFALAAVCALGFSLHEAVANPLSDPFAAAPKTEVPSKLVVRIAPVAPAPSASNLALGSARPALPAGLRVILLMESGSGLLSQGDAGSTSITVSHGKWVRINDQDYYAEIFQSSVRLFSAAGGRLMWAGTLAGSSTTPLPADTSQFRYVPPLSAGVNPGLGDGTGAARSVSSMISKTAESK